MNINDFAGSWKVHLHPEAGTDPHVSFATFGADGTLLVSPPSVEVFPPAPSGIVHVGAGHGVWKASSGDQIQMQFSAQANNADGSVAGLGTVRSKIKLGANRNRLDGSYAFQMADREGAVFATEEGSITGSRIELDS